jgi:hypothetical protein
VKLELNKLGSMYLSCTSKEPIPKGHSGSGREYRDEEVRVLVYLLNP